MALGDYELSRTEWKEDRVRHAERQFAIPKASVDGLSAEYAINELWPADSGVGARRIWKFHIDRDFPGHAGMSRLITMYKQKGWGAILSENVGKGRLLIDIGGQREERTQDKDDKVIVGPATAADRTTYALGTDFVYVWKVTEGTNVTFTPYCHLAIDGAYNDLESNASTYWSYIDKYNNAIVPNIGNAAAKTLKFKGVKVVGMLSDDPDSPIWRAQLIFQWFEDGWDAAVKSTLFKQVLREQEVLDEDEVATNEFRVVKLETKVAGSEESRDTTKGGADFSFFNEMLSWA